MTSIHATGMQLAERPNVYKGMTLHLPETRHVRLGRERTFGGEGVGESVAVTEGTFVTAWDSEWQTHIDLDVKDEDGHDIGTHSFAVDTMTALVLE